MISIENRGVNNGLNYPPEWFYGKAEELKDLAYKHNEQL